MVVDWVYHQNTDGCDFKKITAIQKNQGSNSKNPGIFTEALPGQRAARRYRSLHRRVERPVPAGHFHHDGGLHAAGRAEGGRRNPARRHGGRRPGYCADAAAPLGHRRASRGGEQARRGVLQPIRGAGGCPAAPRGRATGGVSCGDGGRGWARAAPRGRPDLPARAEPRAAGRYGGATALDGEGTAAARAIRLSRAVGTVRTWCRIGSQSFLPALSLPLPQHPPFCAAHRGPYGPRRAPPTRNSCRSRTPTSAGSSR
jgi:hypothetical protein